MKTPFDIIVERFGTDITNDTHPCYFVAANVFVGLMEAYAKEVIENPEEYELDKCDHNPVKMNRWYECTKCGKIM